MRSSYPPPRARRYFRVDPRLVHATVVNSWVPATGARVVVVVDRGVALDPKRRAIFEMSAMGSFEVLFCDEQNAPSTVECCSPADPVLVLFSELETAEAAVAAGLPMDRLNIGHLPEGPGRAQVHPAVFLGEPERAAITRLTERGVEVVVQPLPHDKVKSMSRLHPGSLPVSAGATVRREGRVRIVNERGLHLRAAHALVRVTTALQSEVRLGAPGQMVNAKSLLGLTTLGATRGTELQLVVEGPDADEGFRRISALFESGFEEGSREAGA